MQNDAQLDDKILHRIIEMAWEDRTTFDAILFQFNLPEKEVIKLMRRTLKPSSFRLWRKRVNSGVSQKHQKKGTMESIGLNVLVRNISQGIK